MHVPNNYPRVWRGKKRTSRVEGHVQGNRIDKSRGRGKHKHGLYVDCEHKRRRVVALPVCKNLSRHGTRLFDYRIERKITNGRWFFYHRDKRVFSFINVPIVIAHCLRSSPSDVKASCR
jgi:hypothetical protein